MTPEMIKAIASLWKLVSSIAILLAIIFFRKPIEERLRKLLRVKTKGAEVEFADEIKEAKEIEAVSSPPKLEEDTDKKITTESHTQLSSNENLFGKMIDAFFNKKREEAKKLLNLYRQMKLTSYSA